MLEFVGASIPASTTIFTRPGCEYCAKAKMLLKEKSINFEELILNRDFSIKTLKAVSGETLVPQIFMDGVRIGGSDDLAKHFSK